MKRRMQGLGALLVLGVAATRAAGSVTLRDDTGQPVTLAHPARRVVSLAPSTTEMIFAIGAQGELVGGSNADDYPPAAKKLPRMGSFSGPDLERIVAARPELVVAAYGNPLALIERLRRMRIAVYVSNPANVEGVWRVMEDLGRLTGRQAAARSVTQAARARLRRVAARVGSRPPVPTLVVIWDDPLTVAGGKSFIQDILRRAGGVNVAAGMTTAYPTLDPERLVALNPAVVLFPVSGGPGRVEQLKRRPGFQQVRAAQTGRFYTLNPDWLMRAGPRVVDGVEAVAQLLHPVPPHISKKGPGPPPAPISPPSPRLHSRVHGRVSRRDRRARGVEEISKAGKLEQPLKHAARPQQLQLPGAFRQAAPRADQEP